MSANGIGFIKCNEFLLHWIVPAYRKPRCVAVPSLMAARWVGHSPVLFFAVCGPQYAELSLHVRECP